MKTSQRSTKFPANLAPEFGSTAMCGPECNVNLPLFDDLPPLQLSIVNVPFRSECGGFDGGSLEAFFRDRDVESAREYFYVHEGQPHLSCWIEWREREALDPDESDDGERGKGHKRSSAQPDITLSEAEEARFDELRAWRLERAREAAVPAYRILSDRSLRHVVRARPSSLEQLAQTPGIPSPTVERYGAALLALLTDTVAPAPAHGNATTSASNALAPAGPEAATTSADSSVVSQTLVGTS
jgi:hypothetical protein